MFSYLVIMSDIQHGNGKSGTNTGFDQTYSCHIRDMSFKEIEQEYKRRKYFLENSWLIKIGEACGVSLPKDILALLLSLIRKGNSEINKEKKTIRVGDWVSWHYGFGIGTVNGQGEVVSLTASKKSATIRYYRWTRNWLGALPAKTWCELVEATILCSKLTKCPRLSAADVLKESKTWHSKKDACTVFKYQ